MDRDHLQVHVIPEVWGAAHLPDVKKPERRDGQGGRRELGKVTERFGVL